MLHNESTIVSAPDLEDMRHLCRGALHHGLLLGFRRILTGSVGSKQKACAVDSFLHDPEDGLFPSK